MKQSPRDKPDQITYPPPSAELSGSMGRLLRVFGPGAIIASVTVGTGETIFAPRVGAIFGYALLWVVVAAVVFKAVQVYTGARYLVLTGEHPIRAWARIPGPRAWVPVMMGIVSVVAFPLWIAALADAVSSLCVWITGGSGGANSWGRPLWGTGIILAAMLLSSIQTYNIVERVSTVILALKIIFIVVAVLSIKPDWAAALWGAVVPHVPDYQTWVLARYPDVANRSVWLEIAVLMGVVGGGVQDYVGYVGFLREKRWGAAGVTGVNAGSAGPHLLSLDGEVVARGLRWLRAPALDVLFSFGSVLLITLCFMILGAAVLHPFQLVPTDADLYSKQSQFLALVHPRLVAVYKAGIFFAIFGVLYGAFELYVRTAYELLSAIWPRRPWTIEGLRLWVTLYSGLGGLLLLWSGFKTVVLASLIAPFAGVFGCGLWCFAMLWVERIQLPPVYRMNRWLMILTFIAGLTMTVIGGYVMARPWLR